LEEPRVNAVEMKRSGDATADKLQTPLLGCSKTTQFFKLHSLQSRSTSD